MRMPNRELEKLYQRVKFYIGFKAVGSDGGTVQRGTTLPMVWSFHKAANNLNAQLQYAFPKLQELYGPLFEEVTGRQLQESDVRLSFCPADDLVSAVMLDDIEDTCGAHVYVETSPNNFQGHYMLSRPAAKDEAECVIRMLRDYYGGDPGAAKVRQGRRFVQPGMQCITDWYEVPVDVDYAVKHYYKAPSEEISVLEDGVLLSAQDMDLYKEVWDRKLRLTRDIKHPLGDKSTADFGLALFVLEKGSSASVAKAAIACARTSLHEDKGSYAARYLQKTVESAVATREQSLVKKRLSI